MTKLIVFAFCAILINFAQVGGKYAITVQITDDVVPPALLHLSWILATFVAIIAVFIMASETYKKVDRYSGRFRIVQILSWCLIVFFAAFYAGVAFPGFYLLHSQVVAVAFDWVAFLAGTYLMFLFVQKLVPTA